MLRSTGGRGGARASGAGDVEAGARKTRQTTPLEPSVGEQQGCNCRAFGSAQAPAGGRATGNLEQRLGAVIDLLFR